MASPGSGHDWTATALFSPSKALAQQAQAKDWAAVDAWLAKKYAPARRPPVFERHEETLQALLTLATLSESADEQRALVDRVHKAALQSLRKGNTTDATAAADLKVFFKALEGDEALGALANTAVALDAPDVRLETLAATITNLTGQNFAADQLLQRAQDQLTALKTDRQKADAQLKELNDDAFQPLEALGQQTNDWIRSAKQLKAKLAEYDERLASSRSAEQPKIKIKIEDVKRQSDELSAQQDRLKELEVQLRAFESLPSDTKAAWTKLETAREELRALTKTRDDLFEQLVDGG